VRIDDYAFGRIVVDGREARRDLVITPSGVQPDWWRREGHVLSLDDLGGALAGGPARLVVGTGAEGRMRPEPGLADELRARQVTLEAMPTPDAVRRVNELVELGEVDWAAALHLTC
jgi:hypothetical protein